MMMKREYPELLRGSERKAAKKLADSVQNPTEYLWDIRKEDRFKRDFKSTPGERVAYHAPCHLRTQGAGFRGRDLIKLIPGVKTQLTMECCGHDGTYAMKTESYETSIRIGEKAFNSMEDTKAEVWATDCPLAAIQFGQHAGKKPMHPMSILAKAYQENGFPTKIESHKDKE
jgi:Fe-S oxidoreductase